MNIFQLEPGLFIWTWATFGVLFFILYKWVFPHLIEGIKQREEKIAASVDKALEIEERLARIKDEHDQIIAEANKKADRILRQIHGEADDLRKRLETKAHAEATAILEEAKKKIAEERESLLHELRDDIAGFVCEAAGKLVGESFTGEKERKWARDLADKL